METMKNKSSNLGTAMGGKMASNSSSSIGGVGGADSSLSGVATSPCGSMEMPPGPLSMEPTHLPTIQTYVHSMLSAGCPFATSSWSSTVRELLALCSVQTSKGVPLSPVNSMFAGLPKAPINLPSQDMLEDPTAHHRIALPLSVLSALAFEKSEVIREVIGDQIKDAKVEMLGIEPGDDEADEEALLSGFVLVDRKVAIVAIRGLSPSSISDHLVSTDVELTSEGFHRGLYRSAAKLWWGAQLRLRLRNLVLQHGVKVFFCGHSIGGGIAQILAFLMASEYESTRGLKGVVTFNSPRIGNCQAKLAIQDAIIDNQMVHYQLGAAAMARFPPRDRHVMPEYATNHGVIYRIEVQEQDTKGEAKFEYWQADSLKQDSLNQYAMMRFAEHQPSMKPPPSADARLWAAMSKTVPITLMHSLPVLMTDAISSAKVSQPKTQMTMKREAEAGA